MKKIIFLYTELAGYMLACMKKLAADRGVEVHVVIYPVNSIAPFQFSLEGKNLFFYERQKYSDQDLLKLCTEIGPDIIFCSGWIDKGYLNICNHYLGKVKTVMTLDNPWRSTLKQNIASVFGPFRLRKYFSHCWAAGSLQSIYAKKLGFKADKIKEGLYCCDYDYFHSQYLQFKDSKEKTFPKKIIFVGRYAKLKGVKEMWKAFEIFQQKQPNEWELWCLGKGPFDPDFPNHPKIKNFGFVQPGEMKKFIAETGVFILPAHYEHWGVVVHEFASAGFPLICSTTTSAAIKFLEDGKNGYFHDPCSVDSLVEVFMKVLNTPSDKLSKMGAHSAERAALITPDTWCDTALEFLNEK
ncbi:MAG TPA: glycosyltransferase [Bacteroidia bacterium]|nr:glycosyltransferase [Bacteroidia bacterium]